MAKLIKEGKVAAAADNADAKHIQVQDDGDDDDDHDDGADANAEAEAKLKKQDLAAMDNEFNVELNEDDIKAAMENDDEPDAVCPRARTLLFMSQYICCVCISCVYIC